MRTRFRLLQILFVVSSIIAVALAFFALTAQRAQDRPFFSAAPKSLNSTLVIAHQGGAGLWPGNTMYAFERALQLGADVLEMDLQSTR
ncbi:MAG: glycerophosphodiester phosphodiesterase family protein [Pyrinomonadaceae bacterium]